MGGGGGWRARWRDRPEQDRRPLGCLGWPRRRRWTTPPPRAGGCIPPIARVGRTAGKDILAAASVGLGDYHPGRKKTEGLGRPSARGGVSGVGGDQRKSTRSTNRRRQVATTAAGIPHRGSGGGLAAAGGRPRCSPGTGGDAGGGGEGTEQRAGPRRNGRPSAGRGPRPGRGSRGHTLPMHTNRSPRGVGVRGHHSAAALATLRDAPRCLHPPAAAGVGRGWTAQPARARRSTTGAELMAGEAGQPARGRPAPTAACQQGRRGGEEGGGRATVRSGGCARSGVVTATAHGGGVGGRLSRLGNRPTRVTCGGNAAAVGWLRRAGGVAVARLRRAGGMLGAVAPRRRRGGCGGKRVVGSADA